MKHFTLVSAAALALSVAAPAAAQMQLSIATGGTGGVYSQFGDRVLEIVEAVE